MLYFWNLIMCPKDKPVNSICKHWIETKYLVVYLQTKFNYSQCKRFCKIYSSNNSIISWSVICTFSKKASFKLDV